MYGSRITVSTARASPCASKDKTMAKSSTIFRNIAFTLFLSTPLAAQEANLTTVVATVNGTELTLAHVLDIKRQLPEQYRNLEDSVLFNGIIEQLVQQQLLASSVETPPSWLPTAMENHSATCCLQLSLKTFAQARSVTRRCNLPMRPNSLPVAAKQNIKPHIFCSKPRTKHVSF